MKINDDTVGRYDEESKELLLRLTAQGVIVIVMGGEKGHGFSFSTINPGFVKNIAPMLRLVADEIESGTAIVEEETVRPEVKS